MRCSPKVGLLKTPDQPGIASCKINRDLTSVLQRIYIPNQPVARVAPPELTNFGEATVTVEASCIEVDNSKLQALATTKPFCTMVLHLVPYLSSSSASGSLLTESKCGPGICTRRHACLLRPGFLTKCANSSVSHIRTDLHEHNRASCRGRELNFHEENALG